MFLTDNLIINGKSSVFAANCIYMHLVFATVAAYSAKYSALVAYKILELFQY